MSLLFSSTAIPKGSKVSSQSCCRYWLDFYIALCYRKTTTCSSYALALPRHRRHHHRTWRGQVFLLISNPLSCTMSVNLSVIISSSNCSADIHVLWAPKILRTINWGKLILVYRPAKGVHCVTSKTSCERITDALLKTSCTRDCLPSLSCTFDGTRCGVGIRDLQYSSICTASIAAYMHRGWRKLFPMAVCSGGKKNDAVTQFFRRFSISSSSSF